MRAAARNIARGREPETGAGVGLGIGVVGIIVTLVFTSTADAVIGIAVLIGAGCLTATGFLIGCSIDEHRTRREQAEHRDAMTFEHPVGPTFTYPTWNEHLEATIHTGPMAGEWEKGPLGWRQKLPGRPNPCVVPSPRPTTVLWQPGRPPYDQDEETA